MELTVDEALLKGVKAHKNGELKEADELYTLILKAQPKHPDANHNLGVLSVGNGKVRQALPFLKTALEANPSEGQFWRSYIEALIKLDLITEAQAVFAQAKDKGASGDVFDQLGQRLDKKGLKINAMEAESESDSKTNILDTVKLDKALRIARRRSKDGHLEEARGIYQDILHKFPKHKQALMSLQFLSGTAALVQDPPSDQLQTIIDHHTQGQFQKALSATSQMLEKFPDSAVLHNIAGASNSSLMQLDAALDSYEQALKINPNYSDAYNNMGNVLKIMGDLDAALDNYKKSLKISPNNASAHNNMGSIMKDKGDLEAALDCFRHAVLLKPDFVEGHNNLGVILKEFGRFEAAEASYNQAITLKPDYAEAHSNIGTLLQELGNYVASEASYRRALLLKPDFAKARYNLGVLLHEVGQHEKAAEQFMVSDFKNSKHYLLRCLYLQNKQTLFYDQLDRVIQLGEVHPMLGSLGCRSALKYGLERPNLFCKDPLNYVLKTNLSHRYDFGGLFVKTARTILEEDRVPLRLQTLLTNGKQTAGNLFKFEPDLTAGIEKIIRLEIDNYQANFKDSKEGLITSWPTDYSINGWLVSMKSGGQLRPHMHENGWLSGSIYINVPSKSKVDSGNLVVCIEENEPENENGNQEKSIDVVTGSLCLFPASLLHYTIPFESDEERIVLAFDVVPEYE